MKKKRDKNEIKNIVEDELRALSEMKDVPDSKRKLRQPKSRKKF